MILVIEKTNYIRQITSEITFQSESREHLIVVIVPMNQAFHNNNITKSCQQVYISSHRSSHHIVRIDL